MDTEVKFFHGRRNEIPCKRPLRIKFLRILNSESLKFKIELRIMHASSFLKTYNCCVLEIKYCIEINFCTVERAVRMGA